MIKVSHIITLTLEYHIGVSFAHRDSRGVDRKTIAGVDTLPSVDAPHSRVAFNHFKPNCFVDEPDPLTPNKICSLNEQVIGRNFCLL